MGGYCSGLRDNCGLKVFRVSGDEEVTDRRGTMIAEFGDWKKLRVKTLLLKGKEWRAAI